MRIGDGQHRPAVRVSSDSPPPGSGGGDGLRPALVRDNENYVGSFKKGDQPLPPAMDVAVLACPDVRLDVHKMAPGA